MRMFQIAVLVFATAALFAAASLIGKPVGTELQKVGIAALLFDVVGLLLWPTAKRP